MNELDAELALDRVEARLAAELPAHIAASARAYASGGTVGALDVSHRDAAAVLAARAHASLRARATRVLRVIAPLIIEGAPRVVAARSAERTWPAYRALAAARDAQSQLRFGVSMRALVHALAGVLHPVLASMSTRSPSMPSGAAFSIPPPIDGWTTPDVALADGDIESMWRSLVSSAAGEGSTRTTRGRLEIVRSATAHPRTFVVERGARAIIVVPAAIDTPAARFAVLHELGHALLWLAPASRTQEWPRVLDEAAASFIARAMERDDASGGAQSMRGWTSSRAAPARARRLSLAHTLDAIEARTLSEAGASTPPVPFAVPWALWNDPHAQAIYVDAERIADTMLPGLEGDALATILAPLAAAIDEGG